MKKKSKLIEDIAGAIHWRKHWKIEHGKLYFLDKFVRYGCPGFEWIGCTQDVMEHLDRQARPSFNALYEINKRLDKLGRPGVVKI